MMRLISWIALFCLIAAPASANPIMGVVNAISAWAGASAVNMFVARIGAYALFSALENYIRKKRQRPNGIATEVTTSGSDVSQSFILGRYATAGNFLAPHYSEPSSGSSPNLFLTYVIDHGDVPDNGLSRIIIDGEYVDLVDAAPYSALHQKAGKIVDGVAHVLINTYDGTQTAADPYMMAKFASHPDRPWSSDMIGTGTPYSVITFRRNAEIFPSLPREIKAERDGISLYDPRLDDTVGGSGAHRWNDPSTWALSRNNIVMIYNIMRGIALPDGRVWGGDVPAEDLPLDVWFAAMNECDLAIDLAGGGTEPQFEAGFEVKISEMSPADVIEILLEGCAGDVAEVGGTWFVRVGAPELPSLFITDETLALNKPANLKPHQGYEAAHNACIVAHPSPEALWQSTETSIYTNADWEAEDGGKRLLAKLSMPSVTRATQGQRLRNLLIKDERRARRHSFTLPPMAQVLTPLASYGWTSVEHGYSNKVFEVGQITNEVMTCLMGVASRERDANDANWIAANDEEAVTIPPRSVTAPSAPAVQSWAVAAHTILDENSDPRAPALSLSWDATDTDGIVALEYELRDKLQPASVLRGIVQNISDGAAIISDGIQAGITYEARARFFEIRAGSWSSWQEAVAPLVRVSAGWHRAEISAESSGLSSSQVASYFAADPGMRALEGDKYTLADVRDPANVIETGYTYDGAAWSEAAAVLSGHWLFEDTIEGRHVRAGSLTADRMSVDELSAISATMGSLSITKNLRMTTAGAAIIAGKDSVGAYDQEGFFYGLLNRGGSTGFEFAVTSVNDAGELTGFVVSDTKDARLFNPRVFIGGQAVGGSTVAATSQKINLGSNQAITFSLIGGGQGGGAGSENQTSITGSAGGDTIVKIYDGDPDVSGTLIATFTALGGSGKGKRGKYAGDSWTPAGTAGDSSSYGTGGAGGGWRSGGGDGQNYGTGGGGGGGDDGSWLDAATWAGEGGAAGEEIVVEDYDTSGFAADVYLDITIGQGGAGDPGLDPADAPPGGDGAQGAVTVSGAFAGLAEFGAVGGKRRIGTWQGNHEMNAVFADLDHFDLISLKFEARNSHASNNYYVYADFSFDNGATWPVAKLIASIGDGNTTHVEREIDLTGPFVLGRSNHDFDYATEPSFAGSKANAVRIRHTATTNMTSAGVIYAERFI